MTRNEIAELKNALDTAPLAGKRTMLRNLANGLTGDAIARLAPELANQGPLADGYALALSAYAAKTSEQNTLADRILDGLDRMKAAGEGGRPVADIGPDWRRAFEEKIVSALPYLCEENAAALLTATVALYTQSMALKGKTRATRDGDELDNAIVAVSGGPAVKVERVNTKLDGEVTDWVTRPGPDGQPRIKRPSPEIWNQLSDDQQQAVDAILAQNKQGTDVATDPKILDEIRRGLASDDPRERMRWAGVPLYQYKPYLSDADFRALLAVQSQYSPYTGLPREGLGHPIGTLEDHAELALTLLARKRMSGRPALARKPLPKPPSIPGHWTAKPSSKNGGTNYVNPTNTNDRVRVMPGTPSSPRPESQRPYVVHQRNGRFVDKHGQPIGGANPGQTPEAHIPYEEFIFRR